jgi:hypothetical protein
MINTVMTKLLTSVQNTDTITAGSFCDFVDWSHGSALHGDGCINGCEAHANFAHASVCLMADKICN